MIVLLVVKFIIFATIAIKLTISWSIVFFHKVDDKLIRYKGFWNPKKTTYSLNQLQSVKAKQTYPGRAFKYGDLKLKFMSGEGGEEVLEMWSIVEPQKYRKIFQEYLR